jgi:hypothetical protein
VLNDIIPLGKTRLYFFGNNGIELSFALAKDERLVII